MVPPINITKQKISNASTIEIKIIQNHERAKFLRLIFLVPPKENINSIINPIIGMLNNKLWRQISCMDASTC